MEPAQVSVATDMELPHTFERQRQLSRSEPPASYELRHDRLQRLERAIDGESRALNEAMAADFGHGAEHECETYDIIATLSDIRENLRHLAAWMKPRRYPVRSYMLPGRARVLPTPLGVVGVVSPWNFPVYLAISPLAAALAAGNRVLLKPSELTPRTSAVLARALHRVFAREELAVFQGGPQLAERFCSLPFDHLLYTGSTRVGKLVAAAAAKNLTPLTLELGGKSPVLVTPSCNTLPFGGVGASGMGAYHGEAGFRTFSHMKPVFYQGAAQLARAVRDARDTDEGVLSPRVPEDRVKRGATERVEPTSLATFERRVREHPSRAFLREAHARHWLSRPVNVA